MFDSLISNLLTERTSFTMPKIHNIRKQENQYEVTHVSPSCVRNGVLGVSLNQLSPGKKNPLVNTKEKAGSEMAAQKKCYVSPQKGKAHKFPFIKEIFGPL